jgi:hypothetical protein
LSLGTGEHALGDRCGPSNQRISTVVPIPTLRHVTVDVGDHGVSARNIVLKLGNYGAGFRDVVSNVGNGIV